MKVELKILDQVHTQIIKGMEVLKPALSYKAVFWKRGRFGRRTRKEYMGSMIDKKNYFFLTGLLLRVMQYCRREKIPLVVKDSETRLMECQPPSLPGIVFRQDQFEAIKKMTTALRGVCKYPTRTGKSILIMGIISAFPKKKFLVLAHTLVIVEQLLEDVERFGLSDRVDVDTVQAWGNKDPQVYCDAYDGVIIDEAHHITNISGQYTKVIHCMLAPIRLGFTATIPPNKREQMILEGTLGPLIVDLSVQKAIEMGILTKPKIRLIKVPRSERIRKLKRFPDVYAQGIVLNRARHRMVLREARRLVKQGHSVLILVVQILHGEALVKLAKQLYDMDLVFVQGATDSEIRKNIRYAMRDKSLKMVLSTIVFREGINIPSLNAVINAGGQRSEIMVRQSSGRPLTVIPEEKKDAIIVDFLDLTHHYLISHMGERICFYSDMGWL